MADDKKKAEKGKSYLMTMGQASEYEKTGKVPAQKPSQPNILEKAVTAFREWDRAKQEANRENEIMDREKRREAAQAEQEAKAAKAKAEAAKAAAKPQGTQAGHAVTSIDRKTGKAK